jgi:hypothetical protein
VQSDPLLGGFEPEQINALLDHVLQVEVFVAKNEGPRLYLRKVENVFNQEKHELRAIQGCFIVQLSTLVIYVIFEQL